MPEEARIDTGQPWVSPSEPPGTTSPAARPANGAESPTSTTSPTAAAANIRRRPRREFRQRPIPLRPLSVLELIDGAVGAVPSVPRALLLRAAGVVTASAAVALALTWWFNRAVSEVVQANPTWRDLSEDVLTAPAFDETKMRPPTKF